MTAPANSSSGDGECDPRDIAHGYLAALTRDHAATTCRAYEQDITEFLDWCARSGFSPLEIPAEQVQNYVAFLLDTVASRTDGPPVPAVSRKLTALTGLFTHAVDAGCMLASPMSGVQIPRPQIEKGRVAQLGAEDVEQLLATAMTHSARSHALVMVLARTGLRLGEALARDVEDLVLAEGHPVLRFYRNARLGTVDIPLALPIFQALTRYLDGRDDGPLFMTSTGRRLDQSSVFRTLRRLARDADLPQQGEINPQALREYFITSALDSGEAPEQVHAAAGFTHPISARRYTHPD